MHNVIMIRMREIVNGLGSHELLCVYVCMYELFISAANWNAVLTQGESVAVFSVMFPVMGTVEQMVRQLTRLNKFC